MPDVRTFQMVVELAEQAAATGDYAAAEPLLREAAELQEAEQGPLHPDLASTFNNLAVVCEMAEKAADAEQFYRRAHAIAAATLPADHPLLATSRDNLRDFCAARGIALDEWPAPNAVAAAPPPPAVHAAPAAATRSALPADPLPAPRAALPTVPSAPPVVARASMRRASGWALLVLAVLAVAAAWRLGLGDATPAASTAAATAPETSGPAAATAPGSAAMPASPQEISPEPARDAPPLSPPAAPAGARPAASGSAPAPEPAPAAAAANPVAPETRPSSAADAGGDRPAGTSGRDSAAGVRVVTAQLCQSLSTGSGWRCTAAGPEVEPGAVAFYTRVASPRPLRLHHRWYQDGVLRQDVPLRVGANAREGYRTFSRQSVGRGEWRVELRTDDGTVLDEARVIVR